MLWNTDHRLVSQGITRMAKILIVEDEADVLYLSKRLITLLGHNVDGVKSGEQAMMKLRRRRYDMVLSDLGLPGMSGWGVAQMVKQLSPRTKVGLVSGWDVTPQPQLLRKRGVDFVISKPFSLDELEKVLTQYAL